MKRWIPVVLILFSFGCGREEPVSSNRNPCPTECSQSADECQASIAGLEEALENEIEFRGPTDPRVQQIWESLEIQKATLTAWEDLCP